MMILLCEAELEGELLAKAGGKRCCETTWARWPQISKSDEGKRSRADELKVYRYKMTHRE